MTDTGPVRLLPRKEVLRLIGISHQTLYLMEQAGRFPQAVILNPYSRFPRKRYREDEVVQWIDSRRPGRAPGVPAEVHQRKRQQAEARLTAEKPLRPVLLPKDQRA